MYALIKLVVHAGIERVTQAVAQAYRELERGGVVYVRRGQGTFVADRPAAAPDREVIVREVAARALLDAHRHGLSAEDLIAAVREAAAAPRAAE